MPRRPSPGSRLSAVLALLLLAGAAGPLVAQTERADEAREGPPDLGLVPVGKTADLAIVDANPLHNLRYLYAFGAIAGDGREIRRTGGARAPASLLQRVLPQPQVPACRRPVDLDGDLVAAGRSFALPERARVEAEVGRVAGHRAEGLQVTP